MTTLTVPMLGRAYCERCGLLMAGGHCPHGAVADALRAAYESGMAFGGERVIDRYRAVTRGRR